jgi:ferredoxin-NADP reductase
VAVGDDPGATRALPVLASMAQPEVFAATVRDIVPATPRARILHLDLGGRPFTYLAGQAVKVGAPGAERRPYSIAAAPEDARRDRCLELLVATGARLPAERGATVDVEGPFGSFTFPASPRERRFLFIAGGTGIAPLRAMLHHALEIPHEHIGLFYSARTPDDFPYEEEFRRLASQRRIDLRQTVTREAADSWRGARGRLDRDRLQPLVHDPATLCFVCGPQTFVAEMTAILRDLGIADDRIRIERWGS